MSMDDLPSEPLTLFILVWILTFIIGFFSSLVQIYIEDEPNDIKNKYFASARWIQIFCGFWNGVLSTMIFPYPFLLVSIIDIYLYVLLSVQIPKRLAHFHDWKSQTMSIYGMFRPLLILLSLPVQIKTFFDDDIFEEDIREMINVGMDIDEPQKEMLENVFEMDDISIQEICTHRSNVILLHIEDTPDDWRQVIHDNRHTFYPVCGENEDDIIGVIDTRDYFRLADDTDKDLIINKAMDAPFFAVESMKIDHLFREMTNRKNYFSIVLDEYGGMTGICTLHDIMESLVGEIYEEDEDTLPEDIKQIDANQWIVYGSAELSDVEEQLDIDLEDQDNETFNGFILSNYGHIPQDGSQFEMNLPKMIITIKEVKNHRVGLTMVQLKNREDMQ